MSEPDANAKHKAEMQALKAEQDAKVRSKTVDRGVLIVNTGDGKGKSTAAFGLALRAAGSGLRVGVVQFIKGTWKTGEGEAFKRFPEITHVVCGEGFTWNTQDRDKDIQAARRGWDVACQMINGTEPRYDLVVLDELNIVLSMGYLPVEEIVEVLLKRPTEMSVAVTGRGAPQALIDRADTVTEMKCLKHAFEAGIQARRGIEF
ncbi:MAG TPA: cob(I)yrinic acid a,c-diamide adenosyltransferase [Polyangiaceae bacterium]|jgi:cob(I)alamin adenosyltransferase|nr:cob(I)yrinic acid a,c-diamide adenosyltransferase [Polyangiaceae bacterium]